LEVLLRELTTDEVAAAVERMESRDRAGVEQLLTEKELPPVAEKEPVAIEVPAVAEPVSIAVRELADLPAEQAARLQRARLESLLVQGDSRLERGVLDRLAAGELDSEASAWVLGRILEGSIDEANRKRAISLVRPDRF